MKRVLKWAGVGLVGVAGVAAVAIAASEAMYRWPQARPASQVVAAKDPGAAARGKHVAAVMGCTDCHGANLQGRMFDDIPNLVTLYAPNLTRAVPRMSDADLDIAIRHGVAANGRPLWIMPSGAFAHLRDDETADLIAYLRTVQPAGAEQPNIKVGPVARIGLLIGEFKSEAAVVKAGDNVQLPDLGPRHATGRELARACVECHGFTLAGSEGPMKTPDLTISASYDREDFERLLHTGVAAGNRKVGIMSASAPVRFGGWTSAEIGELHEYLKAWTASRIAAAGT